jgi:hypothetical protein
MGAFGMHCDAEERERYMHSGRPAEPGAPPFSLSSTELKSLDAWIERHPDPKPTRVEALHRLLACALIEHPGQ